jgi:hypothetical protein
VIEHQLLHTGLVADLTPRELLLLELLDQGLPNQAIADRVVLPLPNGTSTTSTASCTSRVDRRRWRGRGHCI